MSELLSIVYFIGYLVGQIQILSLTIKGKGFSFLKTVFVIIYLLIGVNIPIIVYLLISIKYQKNIPLLTLLFNFYVFGIILIGLSSIIYDYYNVWKHKKSNKSLNIDCGNNSASS